MLSQKSHVSQKYHVNCSFSIDVHSWRFHPLFANVTKHRFIIVSEFRIINFWGKKWIPCFRLSLGNLKWLPVLENYACIHIHLIIMLWISLYSKVFRIFLYKPSQEQTQIHSYILEGERPSFRNGYTFPNKLLEQPNFWLLSCMDLAWSSHWWPSQSKIVVQCMPVRQINVPFKKVRGSYLNANNYKISWKIKAEWFFFYQWCQQTHTWKV